MSTLLVLLSACSLHLGTVPVGGWVVHEVRAPVVEPGVDEAVRGAVISALASRGAAGPTPLSLTVERADWRPGRRSGAVVVYDATLVVRFAAGGRERQVTAGMPVADPGSAAAAVALRHATFEELARRVAAEGVGWLALGG